MLPRPPLNLASLALVVADAASGVLVQPDDIRRMLVRARQSQSKFLHGAGQLKFLQVIQRQRATEDKAAGCGLQ